MKSFEEIMYDFRDIFITKDAQYKSRNYFARVKSGQDEDFRTPFWNEAPRDKILGEWLSHLSDGKLGVPGLLKFEEEMASKVGPLSIMLPLDQRFKDIENYYDLIKERSSPIHPEAIQNFLRKVKGIHVEPINYDATINKMRLSTNSGVPFFTRRNKVLYETRVILYKGMYYIAILGWRGQEGGPDVEDVKQRVVWMFPLAVNIRELSVYTPLIEAWQANNINSAYISMRAVEEKITKCFDTKGDNYVIVTDFSKFDQHFNFDLQNCAEQCLSAMLPSRAGKQWLNDVFSIKYEIPIAIAENRMLKGKHGMGSGSGGTNFDECCAHSCLQEEAALLAGKELNPYSNAYGDDGYLTYDGIDVDHIIKCYTSHGQDMNPSKQTVSKDSAVYLRRYFHYNYRDNKGIMLGIYSTARALGRLMGQERYYSHEDEVAYQEYVILRAWSIIENCANHPMFDEFVDFVIQGDKYKLGLAVPGFMERFEKTFDKLRTLDPDVLGFVKEQMHENKGLKDWRIYKYLKSKA
nr:RNA-dependent RNA polymerase [Picobirnavirus sp.]